MNSARALAWLVAWSLTPCAAPFSAVAPRAAELRFDHVQIFADEVAPVADYKRLEAEAAALGARLDAGEALPAGDAFDGLNRDVVRQLVCALQWRVAASCEARDTASVLVSSAADGAGANFVVTAPAKHDADRAAPAWAGLDRWRAAVDAKRGRGSFGVLAFEALGATSCEAVLDAYRRSHGDLLVDDAVVDLGEGVRVVEAYAYRDADGGPDRGTVLRFIERDDGAPLLPGLAPTPADFSRTPRARSDHWVSNVDDRGGFLDTLRDALGYESKVEFASGVVAAGEAVIESTVAGGGEARDGSVVFLPVNNALSPAGHVAQYLEQMGQGVQHVASRVDDLVALVDRANELRDATGEGLAFLDVPRSYYGDLPDAATLARRSGARLEDAEAAFETLRAAGAVDAAGLVDLELDAARAAALVGDGAVAAAVAESRYANLKDMLGDEFDEDGYVAIVRANVLVDAQGDDVLLQIFTQPVLRRAPGEEAPFLEFIQRVCAKRDAPRAGCGGFGIRNFLVLFLSIELNAAADALARAATPAAAANAAARLGCLRRQLAASNPILAAISDAAAAEADGLAAGDETAVDAARRRKDGGQRELQAVSAAFADEMRAIREEGA